MPSPMTIWQELISMAASGTLGLDRVRPYYEALREPVAAVMSRLAVSAAPDELGPLPEVRVVGARIFRSAVETAAL